MIEGVEALLLCCGFSFGGRVCTLLTISLLIINDNLMRDFYFTVNAKIIIG